MNIESVKVILALLDSIIKFDFWFKTIDLYPFLLSVFEYLH